MPDELLDQRDTDFVRDNLIFNYCLGDDDRLLIESYVHNNRIDIRFDPQHFYFLITGLHKKFTVRYTPETFTLGVSRALDVYDRMNQTMQAHGYAGNCFLVKEDNSKQIGVLLSPGKNADCTPEEMAQHLLAAYKSVDDPYPGGLGALYTSTSFVGPYAGYEQIHTAFLDARRLNDLIFFGVRDVVITEAYRERTARPCDVTAVLGNIRSLLHTICTGTLSKALHQADYLLDEMIAASYSMTNYYAFHVAFEDQLGMLETVYPGRVQVERRPRNAFYTLAQYKDYVHDALRTVFAQLSGVTRYSPTLLIALSTINRNFTRDLSLTQLSEYAYTNPSTLSSEFNAEVGMSLSEYVAGMRIQKAQHLLLETDIPIADVAAQAGFSSAKYFREIFKKQTGLSPQGYRQKRP